MSDLWSKAQPITGIRQQQMPVDEDEILTVEKEPEPPFADRQEEATEEEIEGVDDEAEED
jgi:hypothetical protein